MLGQRRRRWPNIKPALFECLVFPVGLPGDRGNDYSGHDNAQGNALLPETYPVVRFISAVVHGGIT